MDIYTVSFFGHRDFYAHHKCEAKLEPIIRELLNTKEYVDFLVGRNGEFDVFASSIVRRAKKNIWDANSSLVLVLPYPTSEYTNSQEYFEDFYDEIEISEKASMSHFKSAMQIRNKEMVDRSDLVICYIERNSGGAYQTIEYAKKQNKRIINLAEDDSEDDD